MSLLEVPPFWYTVVALLWSGYQGARGIVETRIANADRIEKWPLWQKLIVLDIHDFAFRFVCTLAGFLSLIVSFRVASSAANDVSAGAVALLASSFLIGVVGVGGQLHYLLLFGKFPGTK